MVEDYEGYFSGAKLRGEEFAEADLDRWYSEEANAYINLGHNDEAVYPYDTLNGICGFDMLPGGMLGHVVGIGSAHGKEFHSIIHRISHLTIVEAERRYWVDHIERVPCTYIAPSPSGELPLKSGTANVVTCFGVLHHIAKVSTTIAEIARVMQVGGHALIREPIISMGDWRQHRSGLTKNERGIPLRLFDEFLSRARLTVVRRLLIGFAPLLRLGDKVGRHPWSHRSTTLLDICIGRLYTNVAYHRVSMCKKLTPTSVFYVVKRET